MRDMNDIAQIQVQLQGVVSLDLERVEEDPRWDTISRKYDLNDPEQRKQALFEYLGSYIAGERLFDSSFMPSTNGPADLFILDMEELSNGNGNGASNSNGSGDSESHVRSEAD